VTDPKTPVPAVEVLDDEDVRRRVRSGELVPMTKAKTAPPDPLMMKRLRELAARPLKNRGGAPPRGDA
jgi:hypothetical protein